jgi:hypothetical protein
MSNWQKVIAGELMVLAVLFGAIFGILRDNPASAFDSRAIAFDSPVPEPVPVPEPEFAPKPCLESVGAPLKEWNQFIPGVSNGKP